MEKIAADVISRAQPELPMDQIAQEVINRFPSYKLVIRGKDNEIHKQVDVRPGGTIDVPPNHFQVQLPNGEVQEVIEPVGSVIRFRFTPPKLGVEGRAPGGR